MKRIINIVLVFFLCVSTVNVFEAATINEKILYTLEEDYISLINTRVDISDELTEVGFDTSMNQLEADMELNKTIAEGNTSVYFDNDNNKEENILKVDIDFTAKALSQPLNVMFILDQSGSMNMYSSNTSDVISTSPCMHEDHYYRVDVTIDTNRYFYYFNPQATGITAGWDKIRASDDLANHIKVKAIETGRATELSTVKINTTFNGADAMQDHHYEIIDVDNKGKNIFFYDHNSANENTITDAEKVYFNKLSDAYTGGDTTPRFYSPHKIDSIPGTTAQEKLEHLDATGKCHDRMMVSKILFGELSNDIIAANPESHIGYKSFAGFTTNSAGVITHSGIYAEAPLSTSPFGVDFYNTIGQYRTNWELGLSEAKKEFDKHVDRDDVVIFVTDGNPTQGQTATSTLSKQVDELGAVVYYVGIDLQDDVFTKYEAAMSTNDSKGEPQTANGKSVDDLLEIKNNLKEVLTSTSDLSTTVGELFKLRFDETHPMTLTYRLSDVEETQIVTIKTAEDLIKYGITYDEKTKGIHWNFHEYGITHARISFYQEFDYTSVQWDQIKIGNTQEGTSPGPTIIDYVDYTGTDNRITLDKQANALVSSYSELTIENTTSTPTNVEVNDDIDYTITVRNTGNLTAENLIVRQVIPENTTYQSTVGATYDAIKNELIYRIPLLEPGESASFTYKTKAIEENTTIYSSAQLGVENRSNTLNADGNPILSAVVLEHSTPEYLPQVTLDITKINGVDVSTTTADVYKNEEVVITATGSSFGTPDEDLQYQWFVQNSENNWVPIVGATGITYSPDTSNLGTQIYKVEMTDNDGDVATSEPITATVNVLPYTVTTDANGGEFTDTTDPSISYNTNNDDIIGYVDVKEPTKTGNIFLGWQVPGETELLTTEELEARTFTSNTTVTAMWEEDINGDGTPDKYQTVVTYETVNGTWDGATTSKQEWVTFYDSEGNPSETGTATLPTAPTSVANDGYSESGSWDVTPPTTITKDAGAPTYTFTHTPEGLTGSLLITTPSPEGTSTTVNRTENVTITATGVPTDGNTDHLEYKWFVEDETGAWVEVPGVVTSTYTPSTDELGTKEYRVEITDTRNGAEVTTNEVTVTVEPHTVTTDANGGTFSYDTTTKEYDTGNDDTLTDGSVLTPTNPGNVLVGWRLPDNTVITTTELEEREFSEDTTVTAVWEVDVLVDPTEEDLNGDMPGDGIPDIYQATVVHNVTNGTWTSQAGSPTSTSEVVTFKKDGNPSNETGATADYIEPSGTPTNGYEGGTWIDNDSTGSIPYVAGVTTVTYEYIYTPIIPTVTQAVTNPGGIAPETDAVTVQQDGDVTLTATGMSTGSVDGDLTYKWYTQDALGNLTEIPGATGATYNPVTSTLGSITYVVEVTDGRNGQTATSEPSVVTVVPYDITFEGNGGTFTDGNTSKADVTENDKTVTNTVEIPTNPGNVLVGWTIEGVEGTFTTEEVQNYEFPGDKTVTAVWTTDTLVDPTEEDLNGDMPGDGIPDIYQATVVHNVTNGTWTSQAGSPTSTSEVVTFKDGDGNLSLDPTVATATYTPPTGTATNGYEGGAWIDNDSTGSIPYVAGVTTVTYEYIYTPIIPTVTQAVTNPGGIAPETDAVTVQQDGDVTLTATGMSTGSVDGDLTYKWYTQDALGNLTEIPGATGATYNPVTSTLGSITYVVEVTDGRNGQTATSEPSVVTVVPYDITFEGNGGTFTDGNTSKADVTENDKTVTNTVEIPTNPGNVLVGWTIEGVEGTFTTEEVQNYEFPGDKTVTAVWTTDTLVDPTEEDLNGADMPGDGIPDIYQTTVNHVVTNGTWTSVTGDPTSTSEVVTFKKGDKPSNEADATASFTKPTSTGIPGYDEGRWTTVEPNETLLFTTEEVTYTYEYVANSYEVDFHGSESTSTDMPNQSFVYDEDAKALSTNTFVKEGSLFVGWSLTENGTTVDYTNEELVTNLTAENNGIVNLYAVWVVDENNDGIEDIYQTKVIYKIINGTWAGRAMKDDIVEWVTFYKDGVPSIDPTAVGTINSTPAKMFADEHYDQATGRWIETPLTQIVGPTREVFTFTYTYGPMLVVTYPGVPDVPGGTLPTDSFEIENGGEITIDNVDGKEPQKQIITEDTALKEPTKEGYIFTGYEYNPDTNTLTATWTRNEYTVSYEENGGSEVPDQTVEFGGSIIEPANPTKPGYEFVGWYLDPELTVRFDFSTPMPAGNITLYAKYSAIQTKPSTGDNTQTVLWAGLIATTTLGFIVLRKTRKTIKVK